jgi:hypothetical protein
LPRCAAFAAELKTGLAKLLEEVQRARISIYEG